MLKFLWLYSLLIQIKTTINLFLLSLLAAPPNFQVTSRHCRQEAQKVLSSERKATGTVPYGKSVPDYRITFMKRLDWVATFRIKTHSFTRVIHFNWLAKLNCGDLTP